MDDSGTGHEANRSCCAPQRDAPQGRQSPAVVGHRTMAAERGDVRDDWVDLPGGTFLMGTDDDLGHPLDREGPVREVSVAPFSIRSTAVTNAEFEDFVQATGYRTEAERYEWSFVFHLLVHADATPHVMQGSVPGAPWWRAVRGAAWRAPGGPGSSTEGLLDHPAVHVSWNDARAYCEWSGTRLPTEAEWEYAARGGLVQARYPWGEELKPGGEHRCNIWQGQFPVANSADDGWLATAPAKSFTPNGFGLYNMVGNVWELCADTWDDLAVGNQQERVIRGGSYLCHDSYCNRYRVAARSHTGADSSSGNTGFRVAREPRNDLSGLGGTR